MFKERVGSLVQDLGRQIDTYTPLMKASGYAIDRLDVELFLGFIPSISPVITQVADPDIKLMLAFFKDNPKITESLVKNPAEIVAQLEAIVERVKGLQSSVIARSGTSSTATGSGGGVGGDALMSLLDHPEYRLLLKESMTIVANQVKSKALSKLFSFMAASIGNQAVVIKGYEMREFSVDFALLPSVRFAMIKSS